MRRRSFILTGGAALLGACSGGGAAPRGTARAGADVLSVARGAGAGRFARAAGETGVAETLAGPGPFTLFAPTDRAFAAAARRSPDLARLVAYHVVPGELTSEFLEGMDVNHTTLLGTSLNVDGSGGALRVNGASVLRADLMASNGVVFLIDTALTPR
ncbi:fasciclin domain-containing protein [Amaricoccus sp.]|uniref:fasciclin domain-containing protein n=1 Tax=Amaricoccus sp. TaxID=1872485 RepID=UPI001B61D57A|nr:fasciclin domain-containing protein [Amaricoccus sp.]MBP7001052.1 fasciclin domain-containing protein [Amaricoccus sp.]